MRMEEFLTVLANRVNLMLYYFFEYINQIYSPPGFGVFKFLSFRSSLAAITALFLAFFVGPKIIKFLRRKQIGETIRELGPQAHKLKEGTPTMGGVIILLSIILPVILWADINSIYIILVLMGTILLGFVGFVDDYLKVVMKKSSGLIARYKLLGQVIVGLIVGCAVYFFTGI